MTLHINSILMDNAVKVVTKTDEVVAESVKIVPKPVEIVAESVKVVAESVKVVTKSVEVVPKPVEVVAKPVGGIYIPVYNLRETGLGRDAPVARHYMAAFNGNTATVGVFHPAGGRVIASGDQI